ncbi:MAG: hypothetical protein M8349_08390 [ANME-2 cluster archaeon]|nr:hypothetical protein [ANME-2 cluster archaeon]
MGVQTIDWVFGSRPVMISEISLNVQIAVFAIIICSMTFSRSDPLKHGKMASIVLPLAIISVIYMLYSSIIDFSSGLPSNAQN